jgi:hypothetical protein
VRSIASAPVEKSQAGLNPSEAAKEKHRQAQPEALRISGG